jgi:hypothetical protein
VWVSAAREQSGRTPKSREHANEQLKNVLEVDKLTEAVSTEQLRPCNQPIEAGNKDVLTQTHLLFQNNQSSRPFASTAAGKYFH